MELPRNPIKILLKTEWENLGNQKKTFIMYCMFFVFANLVALSKPLVIGWIFNSIQSDIMSNATIKTLIVKIWLLVGITLAFWLFHGTARVLERRTSFLVKRNYTNKTIHEILSLPLSWHKEHHTGTTIDKLNRSASALKKFADSRTFRLIEISIRIVGSITILAFISKPIAILTFLITFVSFAGIVFMDTYLNEKYIQLNHLKNRIATAIFDYLNNIRTVITLRLEPTVKKKIDRKILRRKKLYDQVVLINEIKWAITSTIISLMISFSLSLKAYSDFKTRGVIQIGTLYTLYGYLRTIGDTFYDVASIYGSLVLDAANLKNAETIHNAYKTREKDLSASPLNEEWNRVEIHNLKFQYNDGETPHLNGINLDFNRGEKIALIGESGSGKSTILGVLHGILRNAKANVYCDGEKLPKGLKHIWNHTTLIPQDPEIFNTSILKNITLDLSAKLEDIEKVVNISELEKVIRKLPDGLDTRLVEGGSSLSGGEKQRVALARGLLAGLKSDIILLDEPTSSLDSITEQKVYSKILKEFPNKTIISTIHRLNVLRKFDKIYLVADGKILTKGSLEELKTNPHFKKMLKAHK